MEDLRERVKILFQAPDRAGQFYRKLFSDIFHYAAMRVPEITDDIVSIDNAMKWGFGWEMGPFELWDARGVERIVEDWAREKRPVPPLVEKLRAAGGKSFYVQDGGTTTYFDWASARLSPAPGEAGRHPSARPQGAPEGSEEERGGEPDRFGRRRAVPGISLQDEHHWRRHRADGACGAEGPGRKF